MREPKPATSISTNVHIRLLVAADGVISVTCVIEKLSRGQHLLKYHPQPIVVEPARRMVFISHGKRRILDSSGINWWTGRVEGWDLSRARLPCGDKRNGP